MNQIYDEEFITRCAFKNINSLQRKIYRKECLKRRNFIEIITYIYICPAGVTSLYRVLNYRAINK